MDYASVGLGVFGFDCLTGGLGDAESFSYLVALVYTLIFCGNQMISFFTALQGPIVVN
jgi:hypothetical protein